MTLGGSILDALEDVLLKLNYCVDVWYRKPPIEQVIHCILKCHIRLTWMSYRENIHPNEIKTFLSRIPQDDDISDLTLQDKEILTHMFYNDFADVCDSVNFVSSFFSETYTIHYSDFAKHLAFAYQNSIFYCSEISHCIDFILCKY